MVVEVRAKAAAAKKAEETGEETDLIVRETPSETNVYPTPPIRKSVGNREFIKQLLLYRKIYSIITLVIIKKKAAKAA